MNINLGDISTQDGSRTKEILLPYKGIFGIKELIIGSGLIIAGAITIARGSFKKGALKAMDAELDVLTELDLIN